MFTGHRRHCNERMYSISFLLYEVHRDCGCRAIASTLVCLSVGPYTSQRSRAGTSAGENKRKRRGHAIAAKFTWKLKGGSIDAFCIKLMYRESCEEIFSSRVTWATRARAMPPPPPHKSPRVNLYPNKNKKNHLSVRAMAYFRCKNSALVTCSKRLRPPIWNTFSFTHRTSW